MKLFREGQFSEVCCNTLFWYEGGGWGMGGKFGGCSVKNKFMSKGFFICDSANGLFLVPVVTL